MLAQHCPEQAVADWIYSLPCHVKFPENLRANFERTGPSSPISDDVRSSVRIYCCGRSHRAGLEMRHTLPAIVRETEWHSVYTTNISKNGCGFFHSGILYPSERFTIILLTGIQRQIEVVWCRRVDSDCFAVGARFCAQQEVASAGVKS